MVISRASRAMEASRSTRSARRGTGQQGPSFATLLRNQALDAAVVELIRLEQVHSNRTPHGSMEKVLGDLRNNGVVVTRDQLNYRKKVHKKRLSANVLLPHPESLTIDSGCSPAISGLTTISTGEPTAETEGTDETSKRRGRPTGTTIQAMIDRKKLRAECINNITKCYAEELKRVRETRFKCRMSRTKVGFLDALIRRKWREYNLHLIPEYNIQMVSNETIRNRCNSCLDMYAMHPGTRPPLEPIEEVICDVLLQMGKIRQPLCVTESIDLANSLIKGSEIQQVLIDFQLKHNPDLPFERCGKVDYGWWIGFSRRHVDKLVTKRGKKFESNRADWSKEVYIKQMYDVIYDNMVEAGVARTLEHPVFMDADGNVVDEDDPKRLGLACDIEIIHPDMILFADETGCNTSQKKDGHFGGRKLVTQRGTVPKTISSSTDKHFTVLGFTAANGDPVLCVVIFAGEKELMHGHWTSGIDITFRPLLDEEGVILLTEDNFGEGKFYPGGPRCMFRGKRIPYLPLVSPSGGITSDLLVEILKYCDNNNIYERREGGPVPMLVLDGHESRLGLQFLEYINDPEHKWYCSLGVPYATSYWQVGDSAEQNGMFKMLLGEAKRQLTSFKSDRGIPISITYGDVIPLVNKAWPLSFGRKSTNKKAIADRGWFPPNRNILLHKEIQSTSNTNFEMVSAGDNVENSTATNNLLSMNLNTTDGLAGSSFQKLLQNHARNGGVQRHRQLLQDGTRIVDVIEQGKRLSSGLLIANGEHNLNVTTNLQALRKRKQKAINLSNKAARKARKELQQRITDVAQLRQSKPAIEKWTNKECSQFIQYKKQKNDTAKPKTILELRLRCAEIKGRCSPTCSPHPSDDEESIVVDNNDLDDMLLTFKNYEGGEVESDDIQTFNL